MNNDCLLTSESVTAGHPDKIADQISDAIVDELYGQDEYSKAVLETMVTKGLLVIAGKVTTRGYYDIHKIARNTVREIGYTREGYGFSCDTFNVFNSIEEQFEDIALRGPRYQGVVHGYACTETPELMPLPISLANKLTYRLDEVRKRGILPYLLPDGKVMVTVQYINRLPKRVEAIELLTQHQSKVGLDDLRNGILEKVIKEVVPEKYLDEKIRYYINAVGRYVIGGPADGIGMSGRKIAADTYGGIARYGGGTFSGKDPNHVDRWGSYNARYIAKNIVAAGLAGRCEIEIAYVKGKEDPVSIMVETFGTEKVSQSVILKLIKDNFYFDHSKVMKYLNLRRPIYEKTAAYGHFGREDKDFTWENTDKAEVLRNAILTHNKLKNYSDSKQEIYKNEKNMPAPQKKSAEKEMDDITAIKKYHNPVKVVIDGKDLEGKIIHNIPIKMVIDGKDVEGKIIICNYKYLKVMITSPYKNLSSDKNLFFSELAEPLLVYDINIDKNGNLTEKAIKNAKWILSELYQQGKKIEQLKVRLVMDVNYLERIRKKLKYTRTLIDNLEYIFHGSKGVTWEDKNYNYSLIKRNCMKTFFYDAFPDPEVVIPDNLGEEIIKIIDGNS